MSTRRQWACTFLALIVVGYGAILVADLFGNVYLSSMGGNQALSAGPVLELAPLILALSLIVALWRGAHRDLLVVLFGAWFVLAAIEAVVVDLTWGFGLAINGLLPLLIAWPELRAGQKAA